MILGRLDDVLKAELSASFIGAGQGETDLVEADSPHLPISLVDHQRKRIVDAEDEGFAELINHLIESGISGIDVGASYQLLFEMVIDQHCIGMATAGDAMHGAAHGAFAEIGSDTFPDEQGRFLGIEARLGQPIDEVVLLEVAANEGGGVDGVALETAQSLALEPLAGGVVYLEPAKAITSETGGAGIKAGTQQHDLSAVSVRLAQPADPFIDPGGTKSDPQLRGWVDLVVAIGQGHADISCELSSPRIRTEWLRTSSCPRSEGGDEHGGATG